MKKHYTAEQKAKIVIEILKEERSIAQIASEQSIHPGSGQVASDALARL